MRDLLQFREDLTQVLEQHGSAQLPVGFTPRRCLQHKAHHAIDEHHNELVLNLFAVTVVLDLVERLQQARQLWPDGIDELGNNIFTRRSFVLDAGMVRDAIGNRWVGRLRQTIGKLSLSQSGLRLAASAAVLDLGARARLAAGVSSRGGKRVGFDSWVVTPRFLQ